MAAPSFVAASTGATDTMGAWTATCHAPAAAGNIIILQVLSDGTGAAPTFTSATNIEDLAGTDNQWTSIGSFAIGSPTVANQHLWIGRSLSTSAPTFTGGNSSGDDLYFRMYEFTGVSTGTTLATVIEETTAGTATNGVGTNATVSDTGVTTLGPDRLCLNFVGINDDNAISAFTGETGGNWTEAVAEYADAAGTDASIGLQQSWVSTLGVAPGDLPAGGQSPIQGGTGTNEQQAQQFTTGGSGLTVTHVYASLDKIGTPTDNLIAEIQTDASGLPSGTVVGSSGSIACSSLTTTFLTYRIAVSATLSSGTVYHLVFRRDGARDTSNYPRIVGATTGTVSDDGETRDNGTWSGSSQNRGCALLTSTDLSGGTVDNGTFTQADGTDGWGVVGFALIGTTVVASAPSLIWNPARPVSYSL